uniref:Single domain-containing protein n=1 Tax=Ceratitis capitata TaxID=7213 RepID=W8BZJ3_CERCA
MSEFSSQFDFVMFCSRQSAFLQVFLSLIAALMLLLLYSGNAEAYSGLIPPDPDNPGKCVYRGDELKMGVNLGIAPCQRLTCHENGSILIEGCGRLRFESCNYGERIHLDKPFPECCKLRYKCKKADGTPYYIERDTFASEQQNKLKRR